MEKSKEDKVGAKGNGIITVQFLSLCSKGLGGIPDAFAEIAADCLTL